MATKFASATGNWSTMVWWTTAGGSTTTTAPGVGDDADLNGKTVTIDQNVTLDNIIGATGTLAVSGNRTITANVGNTAAGFGCTLNGASQTVAIVGNVLGGITATRIIVSGATTILNVTGNVVGAVQVARRSISCTAGTVNITGNVTGGSASSDSSAVLCNGASASVTINGPVVGGSANNLPAYGAQVSAGTLTINGNVAPGTGTGNGAATAPFGVLGLGGTLNITGSLIDSAGKAATLPACYFQWQNTILPKVGKGTWIRLPNSREAIEERLER